MLIQSQVLLNAHDVAILLKSTKYFMLVHQTWYACVEGIMPHIFVNLIFAIMSGIGQIHIFMQYSIPTRERSM